MGTLSIFNCTSAKLQQPPYSTLVYEIPSLVNLAKDHLTGRRDEKEVGTSQGFPPTIIDITSGISVAIICYQPSTELGKQVRVSDPPYRARL